VQQANSLNPSVLGCRWFGVRKAWKKSDIKTTICHAVW